MINLAHLETSGIGEAFVCVPPSKAPMKEGHVFIITQNQANVNAIWQPDWVWGGESCAKSGKISMFPGIF